MLEIKNIVNREINGIPKKEYWIQMQLQMEVCDLGECDFLETRFKEIIKKKYIQGATSNPAIFESSITNSLAYKQQLDMLQQSYTDQH